MFALQVIPATRTISCGPHESSIARQIFTTGERRLINQDI
jgi:hypothetical protein